jgi:hypothetical protein
MLKFKITLELDAEQLKDMFEGADIKFSKAKVKVIKELLEECEYDYIAQFEEVFEDIIREIITDEFEN